ncbi:S8 family serine peptidase [Actinomadura sp. NPDC047616]|uniref:S8 family serine peptidase n=1 Tax=Actinomadura sp. NPDC047616 TaxID=3155914 RepID=UPI00340FC592
MDPALLEILRADAVPHDHETEAIIRLARPEADVAGVRVVSRFGAVATCRLRKDAIQRVHDDPGVLSLKAPRLLGPEWQKCDWCSAQESSLSSTSDGQPRAEDARREDVRRPPGVRPTGAGVVVGVVDFGCDFGHPSIRRADGATRLLALWDQRGPEGARAPEPYGYGTVYGRGEIDAALRTASPYSALGYHPAEADRGGGAHGTVVMDIAAGNGRGDGPPGVAPEAELIFVHLSDRGTTGLANMGDSVRILEAVDFIARTAANRPWVINLSLGRCGGPHNGCTLVELALDSMLRAAPGRFVVGSAGNYFDRRTHSRGRLEEGQVKELTFVIQPQDRTSNELEVWYDGDDEFAVRLRAPTGERGPWVHPGEQSDVRHGDEVVGRIYHRSDRDPNSGDRLIDAFLWPGAPAGPWTLALRAVRVRNGSFHAWLERDEACTSCQARFIAADADSSYTTGTIANGRMPIAVGAYDAHSSARELARFSSAGPTRDLRLKPEIVAPGVRVLAARSAPRGSRTSPGLATRKSGTSMAAPHVTGAVALCFEAAGGQMDAERIRELLLASADPLTSNGTWPMRDGRGALHIEHLVALASTQVPLLRAQPVVDPDVKERASSMPADRARQITLNPDRLYREIVYRSDGRAAAIAEDFLVLARPGDVPRLPPAAGDLLVRVALGEPGLGHVAVLASPALIPREELDGSHPVERGGTGHYTLVTDSGSFRRPALQLFRRVLDAAGRMPPGQVLIRARPAAGDGPGDDRADGPGAPAGTRAGDTAVLAGTTPWPRSGDVPPDDAEFDSPEHVMIAESVQSMVDQWARHGLVAGGAFIDTRARLGDGRRDGPLRDWRIVTPVPGSAGDGRPHPYSGVEDLAEPHWHYIAPESPAPGSEWTPRTLRAALLAGNAVALSPGQIIMLAGDLYGSFDELIGRAEGAQSPPVDLMRGFDADEPWAHALLRLLFVRPAPRKSLDTLEKTAMYLDGVRDQVRAGTYPDLRETRRRVAYLRAARGPTRFSEAHLLARVLQAKGAPTPVQIAAHAPWLGSSEQWPSGDTVGRDAFQIVASNGRYAALAMRNQSHFTPQNWATFVRYQRRAFEAIREHMARTAGPYAAHPIPATAIALCAFGAHFLSDAFSSGHMRVPRLELGITGSLAAKVMHDFEGLYGLLVDNGFGHTWRAFGDGHLAPRERPPIQRSIMQALGRQGAGADADPRANHGRVLEALGSAFKQLHYEAQRLGRSNPSGPFADALSRGRTALSGRLVGDDLAAGQPHDAPALDARIDAPPDDKIRYMLRHRPRPRPVGTDPSDVLLNHPPLYIARGTRAVIPPGTPYRKDSLAELRYTLRLRWHGRTIDHDFSEFYHLERVTIGRPPAWLGGRAKDGRRLLPNRLLELVRRLPED